MIYDKFVRPKAVDKCWNVKRCRTIWHIVRNRRKYSLKTQREAKFNNLPSFLVQQKINYRFLYICSETEIFLMTIRQEKDGSVLFSGKCLIYFLSYLKQIFNNLFLSWLPAFRVHSLIRLHLDSGGDVTVEYLNLITTVQHHFITHEPISVNVPYLVLFMFLHCCQIANHKYQTE